MCKFIVYILSIVQFFALTSCKSEAPTITAECSLNKLNNYQIKWEVYPYIDGKVDIYVSRSSYFFDTNKKPIASADIADGSITVFADHSTERQFFLLKFNNTYKHVVGTRSQQVANVENFRDIGGYKTDKDKTVRWGMIYRSGEFSHINELGIQRLKKLRIRHCYSFVYNQPFISFPETLDFIDNTNIYLDQNYYVDIKEKIVNNQLHRGDAIVFMQDVNIDFVENSKESLTLLFQQLVEENNYPLVISSQYGKDYTGFAIAMIQHVLGVSERCIYNDYLLSNQYLNKRSNRTEYITTAPITTQEAVTALLTADKRYLGVALSTIVKNYDSIDNYLTNEIGVTADMRKKLKEIMLY